MGSLSKYNCISTTIMLSLFSTAINICIAVNFTNDREYKVILLMISICIFCNAPCHCIPPPLNRYRKMNVAMFLGFALLVSVPFAMAKPVPILSMIIAEAIALFCVIKWKLSLKFFQFLEHLQRSAAYRKMPDANGWIHYPVSSLACSLYYSIIFLYFGLAFYRCTSSIIVLLLLGLVSGVCIFLSCVYKCSMIVFNKEMILKRSIAGYSRCSTALIEQVRCCNTRWKLCSNDNKAIITIPNAMVGDVLKLLSLCKSKKNAKS